MENEKSGYKELCHSVSVCSRVLCARFKKPAQQVRPPLLLCLPHDVVAPLSPLLLPLPLPVGRRVLRLKIWASPISPVWTIKRAFMGDRRRPVNLPPPPLLHLITPSLHPIPPPSRPVGAPHTDFRGSRCGQPVRQKGGAPGGGGLVRFPQRLLLGGYTFVFLYHTM